LVKDILHGVREAAPKSLLFVPHAIKQMDRAADMIAAVPGVLVIPAMSAV
jgi:hypothetical protein